jgi:ribosome assembly protein YihI (activator of Der GTPase)
MSHAIQLEVEVPDDLARFHLPAAVQARLQLLLDRQDAGESLSAAERQEAEGLVDLVDLLSLLRMRSERLGRK